jgi:hypothetical protein
MVALSNPSSQYHEEGSGLTNTQNIIHRVTACGLACQKFSCKKCAPGITVTGMTLMHKLQGFAQGAENNRMLADIIPNPDSMDANF